MVLSGGALLAIIGGCSSNSSYGFLDAGSDGATTSIIVDAGPSDAKKRTDAKTNVDDDGIDADVVEEEKDAGVKKRDASVVPPAPSCAPDSVSGFTPTWHPPKRVAGACTAAQIQTVLDCTLDPNADATTCKSVLADAANKDCIACAMTESTDATHGPLVMGNGIVSINVAGCVALKTSDVTATGCGAKYDALGECSAFACEATCPVVDDASFADYTQCTAAAEAAGCASYATDAACADPLVAPGAAAEACDLSTNAFVDNAKAYATIFCL
jgi:hypothetical protein